MEAIKGPQLRRCQAGLPSAPQVMQTYIYGGGGVTVASVKPCVSCVLKFKTTNMMGTIPFIHSSNTEILKRVSVLNMWANSVSKLALL